MKLLEAENLTKTYKIGDIEIRALQGVSFTIEDGEFVAIMGPSGSGKSTMMHLLGFLDAPDKGTIRLNGKDVSRLTQEEYAYLRNRVVGFVFQQFNLMARSTALENVALPLLYSDDASNKAAEPGKLLERVGLANRMTHKPNELSGGQQQRVAIARALVNEPFLILADEPTGNLDSKSGAEIMQILKELHEKGMTVVIVTHDEKVGSAAERVIRMQDGKIVQDERRTRLAQSSLRKLPEINLAGAASKPYSMQEFKDHFNQAYRMIMSNKLRSFLSMLGVLIGVACVITMLALGRGAREAVTEQLSRMGSNLISVRPGSAKVRGIAGDAGQAIQFTIEDAKAFKEGIANVERVSPEVTGQAQLVAGDKNWNTRLQGNTADYALMRNREAVEGRFFTEAEDKARDRVVLLGKTVAQELFPNKSPVGETLKINRIHFTVIGVVNSLGANAFRDQDDIVIVPLNTAMRRVLGKNYLDQIDLQIKEASQVGEAQEEIRNFIIRRQRLTPDRYDTFMVRNYSEIQEALSSTTKTFSILLGSVAAISLVVGGIGIMNIMLVSVKERTREIGLRKAIGAAPRDILAQFLVEAVAITFTGGAAGMLLAGLVAWLISTLAEWRTVITFGSLALAFIFSAVVGIVFGLWPAKQASELEPIQSLCYE